MSEEQRAEGSHLIDTNGRRFIDYALPARADARSRASVSTNIGSSLGNVLPSNV
jgi:aspartate oxidase